MPKILNQETEMVPVGQLIPHPRNANQGDFGAIYESIQANGFYGSLIVDRDTRQILAGNHRFVVGVKLGFTELPVTWVSVTPSEAKRILLADNRTSRLGSDNPAKLAALLTELQLETGTLEGTAFSPEDLQDLLDDLAKPLFESTDNADVDAPNNQRAKAICPDCGCEFAAD